MPLRVFGLGRQATQASQNSKPGHKGTGLKQGCFFPETGRAGAEGDRTGNLADSGADLPLAGALGCAESLVSLRRALRSAQKTGLVLALANVLCFAALCVTLLTRPEPVYFGMSQEMKLLPMTPLSAPTSLDVPSS